MSPYYVLELLETNTPIKWWNKNREQINELITAFHAWQMIQKFDAEEGKWLLARIRHRIENNNDYSDWQIEILRVMENFIMNAMPDLETTL